MSKLYKNYVTSTPGGRASPGGIGSTNHQGFDIVADGRGLGLTQGADVGVTGGGQWEVISAGNEGGYGKTVWIENTASGEQRQFAHLDSYSVQEGQVFNAPADGAGYTIGQAGNTGNSTGAHVHYAAYDANGNLIRDSSSVNNVSLSRGIAPGGAADVSTPNNVSDLEGGYTYYGSDEGGKYYVSADGATSVQYDRDSGQWIKYNADTGEPLPASQQGALPEGGDATVSQSGGTAGPASGAPGGVNQMSQKGQEIGGKGCKGGGATPAKMLGAGGIMGNVGGLAQNALMGGAMSALQGGGIQGLMSGVMGSAAGALGNALGAQLSGPLGDLAGKTLGSVLSAVVSGGNPLQALTGAAFGALSQMGGSLIPGLSNVMPPEIASAAVNGLKSALGSTAAGAPAGAAAQFSLAGGLVGSLSNYTNNMTGNTVVAAAMAAIPVLTQNTDRQVNLSRFANTISSVAAVASSNRLMVGAISEVMGQNFGNNTTGGYGAKTRNMQDAMTFSVTTLGQNISAVAADFIALGTWDASNLMRFMQPGNIATQILMRGLGEITGLEDQLIILGVPVAGIDNPLFDKLSKFALSKIDDPEALNIVKNAFSVNVNLNNLGELAEFDKMMPRSKDFMPVSNFRELGVQLAIIGVSTQTTVREIGNTFSKIETSEDLNFIAQLEQPLPEEIGAQLMQIYGFGGGTYGEQTMADFIGTAAGYVHTDTIPIIIECSNFITNHPSAATLNTLTSLLKNTIDGRYTDLGTPGDSSSDPPVPSDPGSIDVPFPMGMQSFASLDDAILSFIPLIESEQLALLNDSDPTLQDAITKLSIAYNASCAQLVREANNLHIHNIDLFDETPPEPQDAVIFMDNVEGWASETSYGEPGDYVNRVASNDVYGNAIKYTMRQARNALALEGLGIDIEQYKLPQSQYYRDPAGFYEDMYTGKFPPNSANKRSAVFPRQPTDVYLNNRNNLLEELGYDLIELQDHQKDEIFYDSMWLDTPGNVLEGIGRNVVKAAIDGSVSIQGENLLITNLNGATTTFGKVKDNGLLLLNNEYLVETLMQIVNRLLYGNIVTTKFTNPFATDQMIFGVLELLAQVTNQNIEALMKTVTGGLIANGLLKKILSKFSENRSLYDTRIDRNDPDAWGGVGPGSKPD